MSASALDRNLKLFEAPMARHKTHKCDLTWTGRSSTVNLDFGQKLLGFGESKAVGPSRVPGGSSLGPLVLFPCWGHSRIVISNSY